MDNDDGSFILLTKVTSRSLSLVEISIGAGAAVLGAGGLAAHMWSKKHSQKVDDDGVAEDKKEEDFVVSAGTEVVLGSESEFGSALDAEQ